MDGMMLDALIVLAGIVAFNLFLLAVAAVLAVASRICERDPLDRLWGLPTAPDRCPDCDWRAFEAASRQLDGLPVAEPARRLP